jgi:membrane associated rhomboid family serine protease
MIPLKDNVPTRTFPIITVTIVVVNILIFAWSLTLPDILEHRLVYRFGLVPKDLLISLTTRPDLLPYNCLTVFTSMFLHGGVFHVAGNMLYLWIFGNNVEDTVGHAKFLAFYLLSGLAAAAAQFSFDPSSALPMIGASGAVSGILGAYLLLFPRARIKTLIFIVIFITVVDIPAVLLLTIWFFLQIAFNQGEGIARFAHIGGFVFGLLFVKAFASRARPRARAGR